MEPKVNLFMIMAAWLPKQEQDFIFFKKDNTFLFCSSSSCKSIERWRHKATGLRRDSRVTKGGKKCLRKQQYY
jgi:hypothetical protein